MKYEYKRIDEISMDYNNTLEKQLDSSAKEGWALRYLGDGAGITRRYAILEREEVQNTEPPRPSKVKGVPSK